MPSFSYYFWRSLDFILGVRNVIGGHWGGKNENSKFQIAPKYQENTTWGQSSGKKSNRQAEAAGRGRGCCGPGLCTGHGAQRSDFKDTWEEGLTRMDRCARWRKEREWFEPFTETGMRSSLCWNDHAVEDALKYTSQQLRGEVPLERWIWESLVLDEFKVMRMDTLPKEESTVREKAKERTTLEPPHLEIWQRNRTSKGA